LKETSSFFRFLPFPSLYTFYLPDPIFLRVGSVNGMLAVLQRLGVVKRLWVKCGTAECGMWKGNAEGKLRNNGDWSTGQSDHMTAGITQFTASRAWPAQR